MGEVSGASRRDRRRDAILETAGALFEEMGYADTSMSMIAQQLGGSKGTLYNYFPSKEELCEAYVRSFCDRIAEAVFTDEAARMPLRARLTHFGERLLSHLCSPASIRIYRLVLAETRRNPQLARFFYEAGPASGIRRLTAMLEAARAQGEVRADDCEVAARTFIALVRGHVHFVYALGVADQPGPEEISAEVARAVETFLARYGATPSRAGEPG